MNCAQYPIKNHKDYSSFLLTHKHNYVQYNDVKGKPMFKTERFKLPVGIFIMLRKNNQVLLQLRQNCSFSGYWGLVGGHLDGNEQIASAAIREVKEEVGIDICPEDLILKTICHSNKGAEYLQFYFECHKWSGKIENKEPNKCERLEWYDWNHIPENTCSYLKEAIDKINAIIPFYEDDF